MAVEKKMKTTSPKVPPKKKGMHPNSLKNLKPPFKSNDDPFSKKCRENAALTKSQLAASRRMDQTEIEQEKPKNFAKGFWSAVQQGDLEKVKCYEIAFKIRGSTFDQSEERVQNFKVNGTNIEKRSVVINFRRATPEDAK